MTVLISGTFKKDERPLNGLEAIADKLTDPALGSETYVVVAVIRPHAVRRLIEDGTETATVRIERIEVVTDEAAKATRELLNEAFRARTGFNPDRSLFDEDDLGDDGDDDG